MTMQSKRSTGAKMLCILSAFLTLPLLAMGILVNLKRIDMNSPDFCGKTFVVNRAKTEYLVVMNSDRSTHFSSPLRECKLLFKASMVYGRLCFNMIGDYAKIIDNDPSTLTIYDGDGRSNSLLVVSSSGRDPKRREACSKGRILQMIWAGTNSGRAPDPFTVKGKFKVVELFSHHRQLAMEEHFCDQSYNLDHSIVQVVNSLGYSSKGMDHQKCVLHFTPPPLNLNNARVCGAFFSSNDLDIRFCSESPGPPWELIATPDYRNQGNRENILFRARCGETTFNRRKIATFCAPKNTTLSLVMTRSELTRDPPFLFRLEMADWLSSEKVLVRGAMDAFYEVRDMEKRKAQGYRPRWSASTSGAGAVTATFSFVFAKTILLVFS